jgi:protein O-GlcNAc transferase
MENQTAESLRSTARMLMQDGSRLAEARHLLQIAIQLEPFRADVHNELGYVLQKMRKPGEAIVAFLKSVELDSNHAGVHNNLSTAYRSMRMLQDAEEACRQAIRIDPNLSVAHVNLGIVLADQRRFEEAIECYRQALRLRPDHDVAHSRMLYCMQYLPSISAERLLDSHRAFEAIHATRVTDKVEAIICDPSPVRPLNIGFVSDGFGRHPVGTFLSSFTPNVDRNEIRLHYYSDRIQSDEVSEKLKATAVVWRAVAGQSHSQVAQFVQQDQIDILFDLDGHAGSRMLLFARKPAPIQITWMGYVGTTGLQSIDYLLADRWQVPEAHETHYCEQVIRMPDGYVCFQPSIHAPSVGPLPLNRNGFVTFGSCNQPNKVNERTIAAWASIMSKVPNSKLRLQYKGYDSPSLSNRITSQFVEAGIDASRLVIRGNASHTELLSAYNDIDIGLDTFPYSGGLTTCEALWMGVPIVSAPLDTFASRHSLSHLSNVGLTDTIAVDVQDYIRIATELASNRQWLQETRESLRLRTAVSPLCNGDLFARNWSQLLRSVWVSTVAKLS